MDLQPAGRIDIGGVMQVKDRMAVVTFPMDIDM